VYGKALGSNHVIHQPPTLPISTTLTQVQLGELMEAYSEEDIHILQTRASVKFYKSVSYWVRGRAVEDNNWNNVGDKGVIQIKIRIDDIIEFRADWEPEERGFARVLGIMLHEHHIFLVVGWIIATGRKHPVFMLPEYKQLAPFENYRSGFFPLSLVDEPRFVNGVHFEEINGKLFRNDWVFSVV